MLPLGTEPLVLDDGTKINPEDGTVIQDDYLVEVPNTIDMQREVVAARKNISDLPVPPTQMNTLSVIISYSIYGITDEDIANVLSIPLDQLLTVKSSDAYRELKNSLVQNILESDAADVRSLFVQQSKNAANTMFSLMNSQNEATRGTAAKDVLDRAGQRPVDVVEIRNKLEGELTIKYIDQRDEHVPTIDLGEF